MSFTTFESAVLGYQKFLEEFDYPTNLLWLRRSRVRYTLRRLYVFRPRELADSGPHRKRFDDALVRKRNVAFCLHGIIDAHSLVAVETPGLDGDWGESESGSHNYQTLESRKPVVPIHSRLYWTIIRSSTRNAPIWDSLGWPD